MKDKIPMLLLEQYLLDELSDSKKIEVENLINSSPELQNRIKELKKDGVNLLNRYPFDSMKKLQTLFQEKNSLDFKQKSYKSTIFEKSINIFKNRYRFAPILVLTILLLLLSPLTKKVNTMSKISHNGIGSQETIRIKGEFGPKAALLDGKEIKILSNGDFVNEGDRIQLQFIVPKAQFATLLSIDGNSSITLHFPESDSDNGFLDGKNQITLTKSYQLDNAPKYESFILINSEKPIDIALVKERLSKLKDPTKDSLNLNDIDEEWHYTLYKNGGIK
ncbi:hypothetical protein JXR93_09125 [bacterium]|nr:hypothetical protein [bacterium]